MVLISPNKCLFWSPDTAPAMENLDIRVWAPVTYEEDFLPFHSFLATWCVSHPAKAHHHSLWSLSSTLFLSPASVWKLGGKTHDLDTLRSELT